jgi:hypothetical protein
VAENGVRLSAYTECNKERAVAVGKIMFWNDFFLAARRF